MPHKPYSDIPSPIQHGWVTDDAGKLVVQWTSGAILPQSIVDLVDDESHTAHDCDDDDIVEDDVVDNVLNVIFEEEENEADMHSC